MLAALNIRIILTTNELSVRLSRFEVLNIETALDLKSGTAKQGKVEILSGKSESHRSHLLHTSGSTGKPKAVQISSKSVIHLASSLPLDIKPEDRIGQLNNPGFDLSLFEIWVTLLSGGTIVHIPNPITKEPKSFATFLKDKGISVVILPFALLNILSLGAAYAFQVTLEDVQSGLISAGTAFGDGILCLLDDHLGSIDDDEVLGEICIGGPGLSDSYFNNPEANAKKFISIELGAKDPEDSGESEAVKLYRIGDLGLWKGLPRQLFYSGRADLQVKRQGFRVELEEVQHIMASNDSVQAAACVHQKIEDGLGSDVLTGFVVLQKDTAIRPENIIKWMQDRYPYYMVPDQIQFIYEIPLNSRGKIDRAELIKSIRVPQQLDYPDQSVGRLDDPQSVITETLKGVLGVSYLEPDHKLSSHGLSSLQTARFLGLIRQQTGVSLSMRDLYANPTIDALANRLGQSKEINYGPIEILKLEADSHLADEISYIADEIHLIPDWLSEGSVFLTGATGFIGANLLARLLSMPKMKKIACLARGNKNCSPIARIQNTLKKYELWTDNTSDSMNKVIILDGDFTQNRLGLSDQDYQWLIGWAPAIFHSAAKVNWCDTYSGHLAPNVLGTKNILQVAASRRRKTLHYISTIDVWAVTGLILGTEVVPEEGRLKIYLASLPFDTGYAQSQWVADEMVQRVREKGLPVIIYRPGFVVGDSKTGAGNPDDFFSRMIIGCIQLGYWPELPFQNHAYVTVDCVCDCILHIAPDHLNIGHSFTISEPHIDLMTNMERLCILLNEAGLPVRQISYQDWLEKLQAWELLESSPLLSLMPLLVEPVIRGATRLQTSKYSPVYDCTNTLKAISGQRDIQFIQITPALIKKFIDFWIRKGLHSL
ncbi:hypothetical protein N7488_011604 [Penicillium malachiteum]|nr:hypothetical protein N7488_011604 [Penicillium malachiteum]